MSLTEELKAHAAESATKFPENIRKIMSNGINALKDNGLISKALKTGDKIPEINLPNATNKKISIQELLHNNKVIISFYRGGWCPYCNLELKALQKYQDQFAELGAKIVAITPETPDNSLTTSEKNNLNFEVLSDKENKVAKQFNLSFTLPDDLTELYLKFGIDLVKSNGNQDNQLPIAATYVIDTNGIIIYDFIKEDYKERADPAKIINALKNN